MLDTGYTGTLLLNRDFWSAGGLVAVAKSIGRSKSEGVGPAAVAGEIVRLPALTIGGATLRDFPVHVKVEPTGEQSAGLAGMEVLKRYNTVIDYQNNLVYLKANGLVGAPFKEPASNVRIRIIAATAAALVLLLGVYVLRRRRRVSPA